MSSLNKVTLIGNLGRDPDVRYTADNRKIVQLSIATSEKWRDKASGDMRESVEWHRVVIFNEKIAEVAEKYLAKGRTVYLEGQLKTRKWQDQAGIERYSTEVVLQNFRGELVLLGGSGRDEPPTADGTDDYGRTTTPRRTPGGMSDRSSVVHGRDIGAGTGTTATDLDDEIPF